MALGKKLAHSRNIHDYRKGWPWDGSVYRDHLLNVLGRVNGAC